MAEKLISLKLDKKEAKQEAGAMPSTDAPRYPYGTCLYLDEVAMEKLGITSMPEVGEEIRIVAIGKVTGTSSREYEGGAHQTLDIQLTSMSCDEVPDADDADLSSKAARSMYPKGE